MTKAKVQILAIWLVVWSMPRSHAAKVETPSNETKCSLALGNPRNGYELPIPTFMRSDYELTRVFPQFLFQRFSPENHIYVFIGSSLTPEYAFMEEYRETHPEIIAVNIPLSSPIHPPSHSDLVDSEEQIVEHFDRFLNKENLATGRTLVVIDYTISGSSLLNSGLRLAYYLKMTKLENPIIMIAFKPNFLEEMIASWKGLFAPLLPPLETFNSPVVPDRGGYWPTYWRKYGKFRFSTDQGYTAPEGPFPEFLQLRKQIKRYLDEDAVLAKNPIKSEDHSVSTIRVGEPVAPRELLEAWRK